MLPGSESIAVSAAPGAATRAASRPARRETGHSRGRAGEPGTVDTRRRTGRLRRARSASTGDPPRPEPARARPTGWPQTPGPRSATDGSEHPTRLVEAFVHRQALVGHRGRRAIQVRIAWPILSEPGRLPHRFVPV